MKKLLTGIIVIIIGLVLVSCSPKENENEIKVGVAFYPMGEILELIEDDLKNDGYKLVIENFSDYQVPNNLLKHKELDANMIQHEYFLDAYNESNNSNLEIVMPIYHATYALYSKDLENVNDIEEGSNILLPDDQTNISRALYLLGQAGLLTFKDSTKVDLTEDDILTNPKKLTFNDKVPLTSLAQKYNEVGLAVMYPTYARSLNLEGNEQRLFVEQRDEITEKYAISLAARPDNKDSEKIALLKKYLNSDKVREFLIENYSWASEPAF